MAKSNDLCKGYQCEFAETVPEHLSCPICLLPLRDPHLVSCCGAKYCEPCIDRVNAASQQCPVCNEEFVSMLDRSVEKKILKLVAYCSMKKSGCQWKGQLRLLQEHETDECDYRCQSVDSRMQSLKKTMEAKLSTEIYKMKEDHKKEIAAVRKEFVKIIHEERDRHRREIAGKETYYNAEINDLKRGIKIISDMTFKIKNEYASFEKLEDVIKKVKKMEDESNSICSCNEPAYQIVMVGYWEHKRKRKEWYSSSFYTKLDQPYKMCLRVIPSGISTGAGTHLSVYVHMMKGEYDDQLLWPFLGEVTVQLVNQKENRGHRQATMHFSESAAVGSASHRTLNKISGSGWGYGCFLSHAEVEISTATKQYLKNDCLVFRLPKIVVHK